MDTSVTVIQNVKTTFYCEKEKCAHKMEQQGNAQERNSLNLNENIPRGS